MVSRDCTALQGRGGGVAGQRRVYLLRRKAVQEACSCRDRAAGLQGSDVYTWCVGRPSRRRAAARTGRRGCRAATCIPVASGGRAGGAQLQGRGGGVAGQRRVYLLRRKAVQEARSCRDRATGLQGSDMYTCCVGRPCRARSATGTGRWACRATYIQVTSGGRPCRRRAAAGTGGRACRGGTGIPAASGGHTERDQLQGQGGGAAGQ